MTVFDMEAMGILLVFGILLYTLSPDLSPVKK